MHSLYEAQEIAKNTLNRGIGIIDSDAIKLENI